MIKGGYEDFIERVRAETKRVEEEERRRRKLEKLDVDIQAVRKDIRQRRASANQLQERAEVEPKRVILSSDFYRGQVTAYNYVMTWMDKL